MERWTEDDWAAAKLERAAIMEYDGGLTRADAEQRAGIEIALLRAEVRSVKAERAVKTRAQAQGPAPQQAELFGGWKAG